MTPPYWIALLVIVAALLTWGVIRGQHAEDRRQRYLRHVHQRIEDEKRR